MKAYLCFSLVEDGEAHPCVELVTLNKVTADEWKNAQIVHDCYSYYIEEYEVK